ncbi:MAG: TIGR02646 family protein [Gallionella sp.]|nr:TIGR02646 family protein [Gallionella sp.]
MKRVLKGNEPTALVNYRGAVPLSLWDEMKNNPHHGGQNTYQDCRNELVNQQGGLCAYCEIDIRDNDPLKCRVEHFHPKSDVDPQHNWALDWQNMLAVCNGGSYQYVDVSGFHLEPMSKNLSCDEHKNTMTQTNKLSAQCEGWIFNPLQLAAFPNLFSLEKNTGRLLPNSVACRVHVPIENNKHPSVEALVQCTIDMLNLNCERLAAGRLLVIRDIEGNKKKQRQAGFDAQQGLGNLAQRYFQTQWKAFFTTIRLCLGQAAEAHLQSINYEG